MVCADPFAIGVPGDSELMCGAPELGEGDGDGEGLGELGLLESFEHAVVNPSAMTNALARSTFLCDNGTARSFPAAEAGAEELCARCQPENPGETQAFRRNTSEERRLCGRSDRYRWNTCCQFDMTTSDCAGCASSTVDRRNR